MIKMAKILDASAIINTNYLQSKEKMYTTPSVIQELKNTASRSLAQSAMDQERLEVIRPSKENVEKIKKKAEKIGSEKNLSNTDIKVLSLALQEKGKLITDDYTMQNLAAHLGIQYEGVTRGEIKKKKKFK